MNCKVCGAATVTEGTGTMFFVMCKSEACARRKDNGQLTIGRVLSNGKPTAAEAEQDYADSLAEAD